MLFSACLCVQGAVGEEIPLRLFNLISDQSDQHHSLKSLVVISCSGHGCPVKESTVIEERLCMEPLLCFLTTGIEPDLVSGVGLSR